MATADHRWRARSVASRRDQDPAPMVQIIYILFEPVITDRMYHPDEYDAVAKATTVGELAELTLQTGQKAAPKSGPGAGAKADLNMHGRGAGDDGPIITAHARSSKELGVAKA